MEGWTRRVIFITLGKRKRAGRGGAERCILDMQRSA